MHKKGRKIIIRIITLAVVLLIWFIVSRLGIFSAFVFPGPEKVFKTMITMAGTGELWLNLLASLKRVVLGFIISFALAGAFGVLAVLHPGLRDWYAPALNFLRHVPPMSLIPLLILWFGIGETSKIVVIVLTAFFPIFMNTEAGLLGCDIKLIEVGETLHMSRRSIFFRIQLPAAVPEILLGAQIGLGYSWRAIVGAEMIAAASGLGFFILDAQAMSRTDKVIAGIIVIGVAGMLMDWLFGLVIRKVNRRRAGV